MAIKKNIVPYSRANIPKYNTTRVLIHQNAPHRWQMENKKNGN